MNEPRSEPDANADDQPQLGTESMSIDELRGQLDAVIDRVVHDWERVVLTRRGEQLVAIIPAEELRWIEAFEDRRDAELAAEASAEAQGQPTISLKELAKELGL
jgi:prevent-host-death family protein